ncbi:MAG TPA: hypothetical protein VD996_01515 [Chitinophagaceae bacterium]|nr:hypothetical protein [Chitinophagaceae bacterium]
MKRLIIALFVIAALSKCGTDQDKLSKVWFYERTSGAAASSDTLLTPANFLSLRPDGSYTRDFGKFEYGTWKFEEGRLSLTNQRNRTVHLKITFNTPNKIAIDLGNGKMADFYGPGPLDPTTPEQDPFSKQNNLWRIPATQKETDEQLRQRLLNHCKFWEIYFDWGTKNDLRALDVRNIPTCVKIYGNGFGLKKWDDLPAAWKSYFYDEEDCRKVDALIKHIFRHNDIDWPKSENKFVIFHGAFQQVQKLVAKTPFPALNP